MNRRRLPLLAAALAAFCLLTCLPGCAYLPFRRKQQALTDKTEPGRKATSQGLTVEMRTSPNPVKLGEVRQVNVTLVLRNVSKKIVTLKFPTTQILEILFRDPNTGQIISQWSSERSFTSDPRLVVINPGERIEYPEPITTRELKAGRPYTLEAYLVGYDKELRATQAVVPLP